VSDISDLELVNAFFGLGSIELGALVSLEKVAAGIDRPVVPARLVLDSCAEEFGYGHNYVYEVLLDLARDWQVNLPLVYFEGSVGNPDDFFGNVGNPDYLLPSPSKCRLTRVGELVCRAQRMESPPVPIGLVNGTMYCGGVRPPFDLDGVRRSLTLVATNKATEDRVIISALGNVAFPGGCLVQGELAKMFKGELGELILAPHIDPVPDGSSRKWAVSHIPALLRTEAVEGALSSLKPDVVRIREESADNLGIARRVTFAARRGCDSSELIARVTRLEALSVRMPAKLPRPMASMIRIWVKEKGTADVLAGLDALASASAEEPAPSPSFSLLRRDHDTRDASRTPTAPTATPPDP